MGRTILPFIEEEIFPHRGSPCDLPLKVEISTFTFKRVLNGSSSHFYHRCVGGQEELVKF